jgi:DMSO/TMAO reductase YedYZ molybdopterin-dependent catalytic subunit
LARDGAIAGALLTAALVAVSFFGWKVAGLPFAPFDIFDWFVRLLPGGFVTFAIDSSVAMSRAFGVTNISVAAKAGDQFVAIAGLLLAGVVIGAALFSVLSLSDEPARLFGGILGAMLGGLALVAEQRLHRLPPGSIVSGAWVFATFVAWGVAFGATCDSLRHADRSSARGRRRFLIRLGGATLMATSVSTIAGLFAGRRGRTASGPRWSDEHPLPNALAGVMPVKGTRAEFTPIEEFYRIDTDTRAPSIDGDRWRLVIGGLVARPQSLTLADMRSFEPLHQFATLSCISNPPGGDLISTTRWSGVSLQRLLPRMGLLPSATHLKIRSADGFFETIALDTIRADERAMLAYAWDGVPLPVEHGFPLRLHVPGLYGMKQPKWIVGIDALDRWEPGYWVERGWSKDGHVVTTSVVDAVVRRGDIAEVGGVAYAGSRGVAKVEVRADDGNWHEAQLRDPLSDLTWVVWRAALPVSVRYVARAFEARDRRP